MNLPQGPATSGTASQGWMGATIAFAGKALNSLSRGVNQVPESAILQIGEYKIISQKWLSKQPPLERFFQKGQFFNPAEYKIDPKKRQCWYKNGIYSYNKCGSNSILDQLDAYTPDSETIREIWRLAQGVTSIEKINSMGLVPFTWHSTISNGKSDGTSYIPSSEFDRDSGLDNYNLVATLSPRQSDLGWIESHICSAMVPFGVMKKKKS